MVAPDVAVIRLIRCGHNGPYVTRDLGRTAAGESARAVRPRRRADGCPPGRWPAAPPARSPLTTTPRPRPAGRRRQPARATVQRRAGDGTPAGPQQDGGGACPGRSRPRTPRRLGHGPRPYTDAAPPVDPGFVDNYTRLWKQVERGKLKVRSLGEDLAAARQVLSASNSDLALALRVRNMADFHLTDASDQFDVAVQGHVHHRHDRRRRHPRGPRQQARRRAAHHRLGRLPAHGHRHRVGRLRLRRVRGRGRRSRRPRPS